MEKTKNGNPITITRREFAVGTAATVAGLAGLTLPFGTARAQTRLKVGVLLPRSGFMAGIGQDCQRGADIALGLLKEMGYPELEFINGDTESNAQIARAKAEKVINDGAQILVGAFNSGHTEAIAQVAEQKGIPLVINISASPATTKQGYKFVFRNFPIAPMIIGDAFNNQKELFKHTGKTPKTVVFMHVNDTFGKAMKGGLNAMMPKFNMPYKVLEQIAYDPRARDLSVEVAKAKAAGADALLMVSRLNDAILITREMVKQRWSPMGVLSMGPGWYEDQYMQTLGKYGDDPISFVPWYDPTKPLSKRLERVFSKAFPNRNLNTNHVFTFEALLTAADAFKRAGSANPKELAAALRTTNITDNVSIGPGIRFNNEGQNDTVKNAGIQNREGKLLVVAPRSSSNTEPVWPMRPFDKRG